MKKHNLFQRFRYWIDNIMSKGTAGMVALLGFSLLIFVLITGILTYYVTSDDLNLIQTIWNTFANTTNAWIIEYEEAENIIHLILMGLAGIVGIFVTSVLVGIFSTGIQERVDNLKKGKSKVLEQDHIVILGFNRNTYKFVEELCESGIPQCIVIAGDEEKDVMEDIIHNNIHLSQKVRIVCRNIDTTDLTELECCSIENAKAVIIEDPDDSIVIKTILTVTKYLKSYPEENPTLVAIINRERNLNVAKFAGEQRFAVFHTAAIVAGIMAQASIQQGISQVFAEIFSFEGNKISFTPSTNVVGMDYKEFASRLTNATPLGIVRNGTSFLNPHGSATIEKDDQIIVLSSNPITPVLANTVPTYPKITEREDTLDRLISIGIVGYTHYIKVILEELDLADCRMTLTSIPDEKLEKVQKVIEESDFDVEICGYKEFTKKLDTFDHIIQLSDGSLEDEDADTQSVYRLLTLRNMRHERGLKFNTVVELQQNKTKDLLEGYNDSEYIITTDVSLMIASQLVFTPSLTPVFQELLTYQGNEIILVSALEYVEENKAYTVKQLRSMLFTMDEVFMGYKIASTNDVVLNPNYNDSITFHAEDQFVVLSDKTR